MAINTEKVQEQAANLSAACWNIANQLRGGMDSSEFKNYILGTIFYRYLSERTELYMQDILKDDGLTYEEAFTNADFKPVVENWSIEHLGYIIKPDNLFRNLNRKIVKPENDADNSVLKIMREPLADLQVLRSVINPKLLLLVCSMICVFKTQDLVTLYQTEQRPLQELSPVLQNLIWTYKTMNSMYLVQHI